MSFSARSRRYALPLITILVFAVSLLLGFGKLLQESRDSRSDIKELLYWSASQTVVEYWRFAGALDRYAAERDRAVYPATLSAPEPRREGASPRGRASLRRSRRSGAVPA